jgi:tRNA1(Val) A37 N6-methylase TrmN6
MLLAAIVPCQPDDRGPVLDAGCGSGAVALALASRFVHLQVTGVEIRKEMADLARANVRRNQLEARIDIITADLTLPLARLQNAGLKPESCAHVVSNPPFYSTQRSRSCDSRHKSAAHRLQEGELEQWIRFLTAMAAPKATISLIHRPENLPELLELMRGRFGDLAVAPVFSKPGGAAIRILVQGIKGSKAPLRLLQGIVLRDETGGYGPRAEDILRHGAGLVL